VFLLAVAASLDAGLVAAVVVLLGRPRAQSKLLAFWLAAIVLSTGLGLLAVLGLSRPGLQVNQNGSASPEVEIVAGVALLAIAAAVGSGLTDRLKARRSDRHRDKDAKRPHPDAKPRPSLADRVRGADSVWLAGVAGAIYAVPGAYYLAGLAMIISWTAGPPPTYSPCSGSTWSCSRCSSCRSSDSCSRPTARASSSARLHDWLGVSSARSSWWPPAPSAFTFSSPDSQI
jgi:Sap, sulfolipid-1-addressing protein